VKYEMQTVSLVVFIPDQYAKMQVVSGLNNLLLMSYKKGEILRFRLTAAVHNEEKDLLLQPINSLPILKNGVLH
jgi:hypothetical protein